MDANTKDVLLALIAGVPAWLAAVFAFLTRRQIRTPSGDSIGGMVERTHSLTATNSGMLKQMHEGHPQTDKRKGG